MAKGDKSTEIVVVPDDSVVKTCGLDATNERG